MAARDRDLAADLAKEIFRRVPAKLAESQKVEGVVDKYLAKELSPGLDPSIPATKRLENIFTLYIKNLEFYLPKYLDELLDEEVPIAAQPLENLEEQSNVGLSNQTNNDSNSQVAPHHVRDLEDSNVDILTESVEDISNHSVQNTQLREPEEKPALENAESPPRHDELPESHPVSSNSNAPGNFNSVSEQSPGTAQLQAGLRCEHQSPEHFSEAHPEALSIPPNAEGNDMGSELPITTGSTGKQLQEQLASMSPRNPQTANSTPEMKFEKSIADSPVSESSSEITEYDDDDISFNPDSKMQSSGAHIPVRKPAGLGLSTQGSTEYEALYNNPSPSSYNVEMEQFQQGKIPEQVKMHFMETPYDKTSTLSHTQSEESEPSLPMIQIPQSQSLISSASSSPTSSISPASESGASVATFVSSDSEISVDISTRDGKSIVAGTANKTDIAFKWNQVTVFIPPLVPGSFPHTEVLFDELLCEGLSLGSEDFSKVSPPQSILNDIWDQIIFFLGTIFLEAWRPCFELINLLVFSANALGGNCTDPSNVSSIILDSWTPGLALLDCLFALPHLLPEDIVPSSSHFSQLLIEVWVPALEAVEHLLSLLASVPYHLIFSLSTYKSLASFVLSLSSTIENIRSSSLPPEFAAGLMETLPSFPIRPWLKLYDETFSTPFRSTTTKSLPKDEINPAPTTLSPCCQSVSVCTCQIHKSFSPQTNSEFTFYISLRFNPQSLQKAGCTNILCSYSHIYLYLMLLILASEPALCVGTDKGFGSTLSSCLSIFLPILLHFKFSLGFPLSVLHMSYASLRLIRNVLL